MLRSRRGFFDVLSGERAGTTAHAALWLAARGHEDDQAQAAQGSDQPRRPVVPPGIKEIRISSNENPLGPGKAAIEAIVRQFPEAGRYPFNSTPPEGALASALAAKFTVKPENIVLGAGSQEILKSAVRAFTSPTKALVTASPSFENCPGIAKKLGHPVTEIKVDAAYRLDLDQMAAAAKGAGLVFLNNPNNPTATVHGAKAIEAFVQRVRSASPDTVILIDEAYHDYVTDPSYASAIPLAMKTPNVFVARTFSKAYGMAGLRIGYAIGATDTVKPLARLKMPYNVSVFSIAAAMAAINDVKHIEDEKARNTEVRAFTLKALDDLGCRASDSQGNFLFVDIGRPAAEFRDACAKQGILVGRDFPPFEKTHARISLGTMEEMKKATAVFRSVLRPVTTTAGRE
ncbi:MAG TPA: histidinol-phosphate transaminase [Vicinamibacterales bacterium]|nr:histidinol-phosphate transaminase [Vicinamibacterales bacterium]